MNFNNYTIKSQEAIQQAQQIAQSLENQQIENEHLFKAIFNVDENVLPFILKKPNVNVPLLEQALDKQLESFSRVSGGDIMLSRDAGKNAPKKLGCRQSDSNEAIFCRPLAFNFSEDIPLSFKVNVFAWSTSR